MSYEVVDQIIFTGECMFPVVHTPQKNKNKDKYEYVIKVECDEATYKSLIKRGISRTTELKEFEGSDKTFITVRKTVGLNYVDKIPGPEVVDKDGKPMTDLIGNGSLVKVCALLRTYEHDGKTGLKLELHAIQVDELIPYIKPEKTTQVIPNPFKSNSAVAGQGKVDF